MQTRKEVRHQPADPDGLPWHVYLGDGTEFNFWRKFATKPEALLAEVSYARSARRALVNIDPTYWGLTEQCLEDGRITSLSVGGCFLATAADLRPGQVVYVRFALPRRAGQPGVPRTLDAQVRYHLPGVGVGVQFIHLAEEDRRNLARYIDDTIKAAAVAAQA